LWGGTQQGCTQSIFGLLRSLLTGSLDPWVILASLPFVAIFSPLVILAELAFSRQRARGRIFFLVQGILLLCSTLWMLLAMTFEFFEMDLKLQPVFYGALCWVLVPAVLSFTLMSRRIQIGLRRFIAATLFDLHEA
jgi:hypothetical protein